MASLELKTEPEAEQQPSMQMEQERTQEQDKPVERQGEPKPETTIPANSDSPSPISSSPEVQLAHQQAHFVQLESQLLLQLDKCIYFKNAFEKQDNTTMASIFETLFNVTTNDLEIVRTTWRESGRLPKFAFESVNMTCLPANVEAKDKEMLLCIKVQGLPVADNAMVYIIGEFEFPAANREQTMGESVNNWLHSARIEPSRFFKCCSQGDSKQLDIIYSTDVKPFYNLETKEIHFDRALSYYVDKGKSRTHKRKFKPVKLTFYEKTSLFTCDQKIGSVQIRVDGINDMATVVHRLQMPVGRKTSGAFVDVRVKVREPLVEKSLRNHEEKFLVLT